MTKKSVTVEGVDYPTVRAAAKVYGLAHGNVTRRLLYGWTIEQAFDLEPPPKPKKSSNSIRIISSIGEFESVGDASKAVGVKHATITNRLRKGWTHDEALGLVKRSKPKP